MCPLGKLGDRGDELGDLGLRRRMAEDRQAEGRLGDEDVAGDRLEGSAGGVRLALVVAGGDDPEPAAFDCDLRRTEHVTGRVERDGGIADPHRFAIGDRLRAAGEAGAVARLHDRQRLGRRQHRPVPGAGMVGMAVGDQRPLDRAGRVDVEIADRGPQAGR